MPKKKTYLDMYLDNSENNKKKKKKGNYFTDVHEKAILAFNDPERSERVKMRLFHDVIDDSFKEIADRVLDMPMFHKLPRGLSRDQLVEETHLRLIEKIGKFMPGMIGKSGDPVKAFSYFSTIAKNYILERKVRFEKVLKNKADVEMSIDLSILSEDTLKMMSNYDRVDVQFDDRNAAFETTKEVVIASVLEMVTAEENKTRRDEDFIKIGHYLMYLLKHWEKIEVMKKNEFMRILTLFTGLKQQQVSFQFKKFKNVVFKKLRPNGVIKVNASFIFEEDENNDKSDEDEDSTLEESIEETRHKYFVNTMEEFEASMETDKNDLIKKKIKERNETKQGFGHKDNDNQ